MKQILILLLLVTGLTFAQEEIINSFDSASPDTNYWAFFDNHGGQHFQTNDGADVANGFILISHVTDNKIEGSGALRLDYSAHNTESWGGYTKLEHWHPDSNSVYDFSLYDTLSLWYNNITPQSLSGRVHLRVNLHDVSDSPTGAKTYDVTQAEYYYSFQYVLDAEPGWNEIKIPLVNNYSWDGNGFNLTGWTGIPGNQNLDLDMIKGFSFEFSINGGGEGDFSAGTILLDKLTLTGIAPRPLVFFNGAAIPSGVSLYGGWGGGGYEVTNAQASTPGTNSIQWNTPPNDWAVWDGLVWTLPAPVNLGFHWNSDSIKFKIKAEAGFGDLKLVLADDDADGFVDANGDGEDDTPDVGFEAGFILTEASIGGFNNTWQQISVPISALNRFEGGWDGVKMRAGEMDSTRVYQFKILVASTSGIGKVVYLDDIWTGNPEFDVVPPDAPQFVLVAPGELVNLITWADVPGESGEVYDIYYSFDPIDDLNAPMVEVVKKGVAEDEQVVTHVLVAPSVNQDVTYYYAVVCRDAAGNESPISLAPTPTTNTAKGITVIHPQAPSNFAADGNLSEWNNITPFRMFPSDGSGSIVTNSSIDGDADCSALIYVAMDQDYLYVAFDVNDDIVSSNPDIASYLRDAPDMFIGLYDWHGASHTSYKRGAEPDYQWRFNQTEAIIGNLGDFVIAEGGSENYAWVEKFPTGYTVEGKFSFADIAAIATPDDELFVPAVGKRIKIDFSINDADATGSREGILTFSPDNEDLSWSDVSRWVYTWIGNSMTDVNDEVINPLTFDLSQNYPNPFNPTTEINFSIKDRSNVSLKVFNIVGQEIATLVNEMKAPGVYNVRFNASNLASGVYIYQIKAGSFISTKKMMLIK